VQWQDVRVLQVRRRPDLRQEPLTAKDRGKLRPEKFQRDPAVVANVTGEEDDGHAARAEFTLDAVLALESGSESVEYSHPMP
jgi:hypothetical protein